LTDLKELFYIADYNAIFLSKNNI